MAQMRGEPTPGIAILWFRRDLRLSDHPALTAAVNDGMRVVPLYILDDDTPGRWRLGGASRWWLAQSLRSLDSSLRQLGSRLVLRSGPSAVVLRALARETGARSIYVTRGYEPFQRRLEEELKASLATEGIEFRRFGGQILIEPEKFANKSGEPFRVFTPFYNALLKGGELKPAVPPPEKIPAPSGWPKSEVLEEWGLEPHRPDWAGGLRAAWTAGETAAKERLWHFLEALAGGYSANRNSPGIDGTSRLSPYLASGEISPRQIWHAALAAADAAGKPSLVGSYLREIVWREFSYHLLFHFPSLPEKAFKPEFEAFPWRDDAPGLRAWRKGQTGYPVVDAGMRQLWRTGWMHNRVRMAAASFLIKHLLLPWQAGEAWFWDTLVDADLANNAASWQWVAGSGADAAPYFRIFNPVLQGEKFDAGGAYVREFCPELARLPDSLIHKPWEADRAVLERAGITLGVTYPLPIVDHALARNRALAAYEGVKKPAASA
jgi:deoxyribodipyrimidine photo-lyase